jgi:hypothetical protein
MRLGEAVRLVRRRLAASSFRTVPVEALSAAQPENAVDKPLVHSWRSGSRLIWEAQFVIGLRIMRLAAGGSRSESEARRLVPEKMETLAEAGAAAASVAAKGGESNKVAESVLKVYGKRLGRNRRRLSK